MIEMMKSTLVIGGCRSGKSSHALSLADGLGARPKTFVATCTAQDEEMRRRIERHQQERGAEWQTLEVPIEIAAAITSRGDQAGLILIDCLTLWISNMMMAEADDTTILKECQKLCDVLKVPPCPIVLVSNEVGAGIVPENALARRYRDLTGWVNQRIAAACQCVIWMVAGIPFTIKPQAIDTCDQKV